MAAHDPRWEKILHMTENQGKTNTDDDKKKDLEDKLKMCGETASKCVRVLSTTPLNCTKGKAKTKVVPEGIKGACESYRHIVYK